MNKTILALLASATLASPIAANAALVTYDFTVDGGPTGPLAGVTSSGYFTFDDSVAPSGGGTVFDALFSDLSFSWNGMQYDETNANTGGINFDASSGIFAYAMGNDCIPGFCFVADDVPNQWAAGGSAEITGNFAYSLNRTIYFGSHTWSLRETDVPEPGTLALLWLGIAGLGLTRRRIKA